MYQLEVVFAWDSKPNADVRILGHIDDGGLRAFLPLTDDFIRLCGCHPPALRAAEFEVEDPLVREHAERWFELES